MKTHLITGAAGFIGSALSDKILSSGDSVVGIDNFLLGNLKSINDLKSKYKNFSFIEFDLSIEKNIQHLIKKFLGNAPEIELADIVDIWADTITKVGGGECPPIEDGLLQLLPGRDGTDGFFIAVMQARLR